MRTKADLHAYQSRGVTALYESDGLAIVFPMGSGKTITALTAAQELIEVERSFQHALVIAPKRVATLVWPAEIEEWTHTAGLKYAVLNGDPAKRARDLMTAAERDMTIIGVDNVQWLCEALSHLPDESPLFDLLIIDELSRFKDPTSKRGKALLKHIRRFRTIWGLTGTPAPNGLQDLFKPLALVTKEQLWGRSFYKWQKDRFYPTDHKGYTWAIKPDWAERTAAEAATVMLALDPADMPELPPVTVVEHHVTLPPDVRREYDRMQRRLLAEVEGESVLAASAAVATGKLAQIANGFVYDEDNTLTLHDEKLDWLIDMVEGLAGDPAIVIYEFVHDLERIKACFKNDFPTIGHGVTDKQARDAVTAWNAGKAPILLMHAASGGHGLNLQFGGSQMIWYGLPWSAELYDQTISRIIRPGQKRRCFLHLCMAEGTVDELKRLRVVEKMAAQDAFKAWLKTI
jgi:SNF2 family DNA or RNA helicase